MRLITRLISLGTISAFALAANAQINHGSADTAIVTAYEIAGVRDSVYIFNKKENANFYIQVTSYGGATDTFEWSKFNPSTGNYDFIRQDIGTTSTIDTITSSLGYRVIITDTTQPDTFRCWVLVNDFDVVITSDTISKDNGNITCRVINNIIAHLDSADLYYFDPLKKDVIHCPVTYEDDWTSNHPDSARDPNKTVDFLRARVDEPYWKDTWYIIEVKDNFGLIRKDSAFYKSIQPHAIFEWKLIPLNDPFYSAEKYDSSYDDEYNAVFNSAPAIYLFSTRNLSKNADYYTWFYGDRDSTIRTTADTIVHKYEKPGTYSPKLVAYKNVDFTDACKDTFPKENDESVEIIVNDWSIDGGNSLTAMKIPNVFTPPNGEYPYWRFYDDVSITDFEIIIYNRYGKKVYEYKGNIRNWDGWDGKNKGTDKTVPTGVYYYVVKKITTLPNFDPATKNDATKNKSIPGEVYKNFIHVFNTE
jgi:gliding motility-associated-like protein